jgi:hypothetical protein
MGPIGRNIIRPQKDKTDASFVTRLRPFAGQSPARVISLSARTRAGFPSGPELKHA